MSDGHSDQSINDRIRYWSQQTPDAPALLSADMKPLTYAALAAQCAAFHDTFAARLLSIDELDRDIGGDIENDFSELSKVVINPSAEGFLATVKTSVVSSLPP